MPDAEALRSDPGLAEVSGSNEVSAPEAYAVGELAVDGTKDDYQELQARTPGNPLMAGVSPISRVMGSFKVDHFVSTAWDSFKRLDLLSRRSKRQ